MGIIPIHSKKKMKTLSIFNKKLSGIDFWEEQH